AVPNPKAMLADRGYDSDWFRQDLLLRGILPVIPSRKGRSVPQKTDWRRYRDRNRIERMFNKLKQMRRIATRYDKTALSFMSFLNIAAARLWIESFVNGTYIPWLNIHKETIAVSVANDGRSGEIQFHGTIPNAIRHLVSRLAAPDVAHSPLL
ncbi:transposase, partial [Gluconobacter kondonii]|uniref:transposase n=3 Tax=Gluconobacter kondonii TaxID=941463 RepID=UPI00197E9FA5|nr:transposase [Gluconobacter kondonii]